MTAVLKPSNNPEVKIYKRDFRVHGADFFFLVKYMETLLGEGNLLRIEYDNKNMLV